MSEIASLPQHVTVVNHLGVSIVYSGVELGNVDPRPQFGNPAEAEANQAKLLEPLQSSQHVIQAPQGGSDFLDLSDIPASELEQRYPTDGLVINRPDVALGLNTADCVAMALYSKVKPVLAVIHAGRHGVDGGIHEAAVRHMSEGYGIEREDIRAYFGPSIRQVSYFYPEISAEQLADPKWKRFIDRRNGNYHIDLIGRVVKDLAELDVNPKNINMSPVDVGSNLQYFSHSRSKRTDEPVGRNGFAAMISR